jgi:F0F1-type ATP synthase alpha subunit
VAVDQIKDFQAKLTDFLATRKADLLAKIHKEKVISDAIAAELKAAVTEFKQTQPKGTALKPPGTVSQGHNVEGRGT